MHFLKNKSYRKTELHAFWYKGPRNKGRYSLLNLMYWNQIIFVTSLLLHTENGTTGENLRIPSISECVYIHCNCRQFDFIHENEVCIFPFLTEIEWVIPPLKCRRLGVDSNRWHGTHDHRRQSHQKGHKEGCWGNQQEHHGLASYNGWLNCFDIALEFVATIWIFCTQYLYGNFFL